MNTVLLLEDDKDLRAIVAAALAGEGFSVIETKTGREATAVLQSRSVDAVLVDGLLPDGSGVDWIARLRASGSAVPVVFISALFRDRSTFLRLTGELKVGLVLYKPFEPADLARRVRKLVDAGGTPTGKPAPRTSDPFAELRRQFAARLPARIDELAAAVATARAEPSRIPEACSLAHRLRGTGGSYGLGAVSEAAGRLEDLLSQAATPSGGRRAFEEEVDRALTDLGLVAARASEVVATRVGTEPQVAALLVVDDDPDFLALVREAGRRTYVAVETARDGREALEIARRRPLVGALLDVRLEGETSFGLARALRATSGNASTPIAFMSMDAALETRIDALNAGGARFFDKPLNGNDLVSLAQDFAAISQETGGKVFIVDDDPDAVSAYTSVLRGAGISVDSSLSAEEVIDHLETRAPDLVLLDVELPKMSGLDVCRALRASARWELLPILMITARLDPATRLQAFRAGASDVIIKPVLPEELLARVGVQLERTKLVRARMNEDALSGLMLRRAFLEALQRSFSTAVREKKPLSIALLDVDHFKRVNDSFGHAAGDQVISRLGQLLKQRFRNEDLRGRWGGEEFILAFPGQDSEIASRLVEGLTDELRREEFVSDSGKTFSVTLSAGIASFPDAGSNINALIGRADELLYLSKRGGRDRVSTTMKAATAGAPPGEPTR